MPRPIPDDVENVSGFIWYLIPIPDDPVFVQAAWDAFSELTYPWNWGKEGRVPESDIAAQLWADAIYEALRVRDMGFPDLILTYIDEVEGLLTSIAQKDFCCDTVPGSELVVVGSDDETQSSDVDIGEGTFPPGTTTEAEARDYLCGAATAYVDEFITLPGTLTNLVSPTVTALILVVIYFTAGALFAITGATVLGLFTLANMLDFLDGLSNLLGLVESGEEDGAGPIETELQTARDDLICAIVVADTAAQAGTLFRATIDNAVSSVLWADVLGWFASDTFMARIWEGLSEAEPSTACDCVADYGVTFVDPTGVVEIDFSGTPDPTDPTLDGNLITHYFSRGGNIRADFPAIPVDWILTGFEIEWTSVEFGNGTSVNAQLREGDGTDTIGTQYNHTAADPTANLVRVGYIQQSTYDVLYGNNVLFTDWWNSLDEGYQLGAAPSQQNALRHNLSNYTGSDGGNLIKFTLRQIIRDNTLTW